VVARPGFDMGFTSSGVPARPYYRRHWSAVVHYFGETVYAKPFSLAAATRAMETKAPKLALGAARQSAVARAALTILMPLKQYRLSFCVSR